MKILTDSDVEVRPCCQAGLLAAILHHGISQHKQEQYKSESAC